MANLDCKMFDCSILGKNALKEIINAVYPIGIKIDFIKSINPNISWPWQEWEKIPAGHVFQSIESGEGGKEIPAGLPNITGKIVATSYGLFPSKQNTTDVTATSAFGLTRKNILTNSASASNTDANAPSEITFNANSGASVKGIYRDDVTTVQPLAVTGYMWQRVS